jgi:hypothetical protein
MAFAVSVLASDQQQVAEYFAMRGRTPQCNQEDHVAISLSVQRAVTA